MNSTTSITTTTKTKSKSKPALPPLALPPTDLALLFPDKFDCSPGIIDEIPEYDSVDINLGAETPSSALDAHFLVGDSKDDWSQANVPMRKRSWRSNSFSKKNPSHSRETKKTVSTRECGICFEYAVNPCRTLCCSKLFCREHISDWLHGSSSDGRCPSCKSPCSLVADTLSLATPALHPISVPRVISPTPIRPQQPFLLLNPTEHFPTSPLSKPASEPSLTQNSDQDQFDSQLLSSILLPLFTAISPSPQTLEYLSRVAARILSIVGLTLILYVLLT